MEEKKTATGLTLRAFLLAVVFVFLCSLWVRQAEIVVCACQVTEAVPAIPAIVVLLSLVLLNPLLRRLGERFSLSRAELLVIYIFVVIAISLSGCGILRFFFSTLPSLRYFATPLNNFEVLFKYIPRWMAPQDEEVIRTFYEGSEDAVVPWRSWLLPLGFWTLFFLVIWFTMLCLTTIIRKQWTEKERLTFPLLYLPLDITEQGEKPEAIAGFFKNPIMWTGFGLAFVYNLMNIANAFNPSVVALGKYFDFGALFTERPLDAVQPLTLHYRPEMVGFGYLVSLEVSFSVWFFYLLEKVTAVFARSVGYELAGFPFIQEQGSGAYIALAILLLWVARGQIKEVLTRVFSKTKSQSAEDTNEPLSYDFAFIGVFLGFVLICLLCWVSGMSLWVAMAYFLVFFAFALVYTRIRAETGAPLIWLFPWDRKAKLLFLNAFGSKAFAPRHDFGTLTLWATLIFLARGYFLSMMGYQLEGFKLADEVKMSRRHMSIVIVLALLIGLMAGYWTHLTPFYKYGAGVLREGIWGTGINIAEYQDVANWTKAHRLPDIPRTVAAGVGFLIASAIMILRMIFLRFPLHPLGYAMATSYGDLIWGSFFVVWGIKLIVFRLGGIKLYRRLIPGFLGLALGHFFTAGILWGTFGAYFGEVYKRYGVWFG